MRILMVSPNLPRPAWGASARNYYLLKALSRQHTVSLVALTDKTEIDAFDDMPLLEKLAHLVQIILRPSSHKRRQQLTCAIQGKSYILHQHMLPTIQEALDEMFAQDHYDAVLFESALTAGYRLPPDVRIFIDQHNIEHELLQRTYEHERLSLRKWYNWQEYRLLKQVEIARCAKAEVITVTSERERAILKGFLPESLIEVIPNGVDVAMFDAANCKQEIVPNQIIFTGTMDYYPNIDAALFFWRQCWPIIRDHVTDATWQIVGRNPPPEITKLAESPGITVTGTVPDVRPYLAQSAVAIAPLQIAGGTRLKILQALAMKKAVVSTPIGCEGLLLEHGKHLLVADEPEVFAQAVIALLKNPGKRATLGSNGRSLVEATYSWERCGDQLVHLLEEKVSLC